MAVVVPEPYASYDRGRLYEDIVSLATFVEKLKGKIEDVHSEVKLRDAQLQKQRADIMKLKSLVGHQNLSIKELEEELNNIIEI
tara:strand:- start:1568 stop:1819 length:252 start_codon:yes stop_codon:yes gene_type:complete